MKLSLDNIFSRNDYCFYLCKILHVVTETNWQCSDGDDRSCYKMVVKEMTHLEAYIHCQKLGSNLVSIESEAENKFLVDMIQSKTSS